MKTVFNHLIYITLTILFYITYLFIIVNIIDYDSINHYIFFNYIGKAGTILLISIYINGLNKIIYKKYINYDT